MVLNLVDLIYVEDGEMYIDAAERMAKKHGICMKVFSYLDDLEKGLAGGDRAYLYIVDGNFQRSAGDCFECLGPEAVKMIQGVHPEGDIMIYSNDFGLEAVARELGVKFADKEIRYRAFEDFIKGL